MEPLEWGSCFRTVQPATAVECVAGPLSFTCQREELVVIRGTTLDVYACGQRLEHVVGGCINESVNCILPAASRSGLDLLVLVTVSLQILVVRFDNDAKVLQLLARADAGSHVLGATCRRSACNVSRCRRFLAVYLYSHIVAIADLAGLEAAFEQEGILDLKLSGRMFYVDVREQVACLDFISPDGSKEPPSLVALHAQEDLCGTWEDGPKVLCVHTIDLNRRRTNCLAKPELPAARGVANVPGRHYLSCDLIAAVPPSAGAFAAEGAVLAVGAGYVRLFNAELQALAAVRGTQGSSRALLKANAAGNRWLLAASQGDLYLLRLEGGAGHVRLTVQCLGVSVPASGMACWHDGTYAFVGSQVSDSEVLHLFEPKEDAPATASTAAGRRRKNLEDAFEVTDTWTNLGPITDFCTKDLGMGDTQLITCSGAGSNLGSLRFIQMGIPVEELGSAGPLRSVLGLWTLTAGSTSFLVLSRPGRTEVLQVLELAGQVSLEPAEAKGLEMTETLLCCGLRNGSFVQVTSAGCAVLDAELEVRPGRWKATKGPLTAACEDRQGGLLVASSTGDVCALDLREPGGLLEAAAWALTGEPSCLAASGSGLCAAGLWSDELSIWHRQEDFVRQTLPLPTLPRSVAFLHDTSGLRLFAGLCDGAVAVIAHGTNWALQRQVVVGMQPVTLLVPPMGPKQPSSTDEAEKHQEQEMLLAISGHGSILQDESRRIVQAPICLPSMSHAAFFSHGLAGLGDCMAFISEERLLLARLRCGERMHVQTLPLPQAPRRIAYHPPTRICVAGCCDISTSYMPGAASRPRAQLQFVHSDSVSLLDTITLGQDEMIASVVTVSFSGDPTVYIAVGTALVLQSEPEPTRGQVRLLAPWSSSSEGQALPPFHVVSTLEVQGAVYALNAFQGRLLGAVNNRLQLWELKGTQLSEVSRFCAGVIVLDLQSRGDQILVGDIMRSVNLIRFREDSTFESVAHDETSAWSTTVDMLSDDHFLCADDGGNLLSLHRETRESTAGGAAPSVLQRVGRIHTGEFMNRFRSQPFQPRPGSTTSPGGSTRNATIWASASGAFGWVRPVAAQRFVKLLKLQELLGSEVTAMLSQKWREGRMDLQGRRASEQEGFLDGDLLSRFLKMPEEQQQALARRLEGRAESDVEELLKDLELLELPLL